MAFADRNLVDGDLTHPFQQRTREVFLQMSFLQMSFLNVLDDVPTDLQMDGHIPDGHRPQQIQGISLESPRVTATPVCKTNLHLS
jgi:hypothetical protein